MYVSTATSKKYAISSDRNDETFRLISRYYFAFNGIYFAPNIHYVATKQNAYIDNTTCTSIHLNVLLSETIKTEDVTDVRNNDEDIWI